MRKTGIKGLTFDKSKGISDVKGDACHFTCKHSTEVLNNSVCSPRRRSDTSTNYTAYILQH